MVCVALGVFISESIYVIVISKLFVKSEGLPVSEF